MKGWARLVVTFLLVFFFLSLLHSWNNYKIGHYGLPCNLSNNQKCLKTYEEGGKIWWNGYTFWRGGGQLAYHVKVVNAFCYEGAQMVSLHFKLPTEIPEAAKLWTEETSRWFFHITDSSEMAGVGLSFNRDDFLQDRCHNNPIEEFAGKDVRLFIEVIQVKEGEDFLASPLSIDLMYERIHGPATITRITIDELNLGDVYSQPRFQEITKTSPPKWQKWGSLLNKETEVLYFYGILEGEPSFLGFQIKLPSDTPIEAIEWAVESTRFLSPRPPETGKPYWTITVSEYWTTRFVMKKVAGIHEKTIAVEIGIQRDVFTGKDNKGVEHYQECSLVGISINGEHVNLFPDFYPPYSKKGS